MFTPEHQLIHQVLKSWRSPYLTAAISTGLAQSAFAAPEHTEDEWIEELFRFKREAKSEFADALSLDNPNPVVEGFLLFAPWANAWRDKRKAYVAFSGEKTYKGSLRYSGDKQGVVAPYLERSDDQVILELRPDTRFGRIPVEVSILPTEIGTNAAYSLMTYWFPPLVRGGQIPPMRVLRILAP